MGKDGEKIKGVTSETFNKIKKNEKKDLTSLKLYKTGAMNNYF